jgi:hypothetical protein
VDSRPPLPQNLPPHTIPTSTGDPIIRDPLTRGRGSDGNCLPCPPPVVWEAAGDAHGSTTGTHWHWVKYNQIPVNCRCMPSRGAGPTNPNFPNQFVIPGVWP